MMRWSLVPYAYVLASSLGIGQVAIAQVTPDTTLGAESSQVNSAIVRGAPADLIEGGAQRGENLFHSFEDFNIGELQRVYFANPADINTILSRVTGTQSSEILGILGVDGPANLFFLNPHGVVFGANATLDIEGSLVISTADEFDFGSDVYSAVTPETPPLLTVGLTPGLQYSAAQRSQITSQADLAVGDNLLLDTANIDIAGSLTADGDIVLRATDTAALTDDTLLPLLVVAGGDLLVQATDEIVVDALAQPNSLLASNGNLTLRSDGTIVGDGHFQSGGSFQIQKLDGSPGSFLSPNDPIIRSVGNVSFEDYEGASLHILAGGSVTANNITITGADVTNGLVETVNLSQALADGTTSVAINGQQQPTLDVRAGTTDVGAVGIVGTPAPNDLTVANTATSADISIDRVNIDETDGLVLLTNQYQPNSALSGDINVRVIDTRNREGGGDIFLDSQNNIAIDHYGSLRTSALSTDDSGDSGNVVLLADGDIVLKERSVIQALGDGDGTGGNIDIIGRSLLLDNHTQIDGSTSGTKDSGDITINLSNDMIMRGDDTRIVNVVESSAIANSGDININAENLTISHGAGIYAGVLGEGNSGNINLTIENDLVVRDAPLVETDVRINSAITNGVFAEANGDGGDINVSARNLRLLDGGLLYNRLGVGSEGDAGDINLDIQDEILIQGQAAGDPLPDADIPVTSVVGEIDVFFVADNTASMGGAIRAVQQNAGLILDALSGGDPRFANADVNYGVGYYLFHYNDTQEGAYQQQTPISADIETVRTAINGWVSGNIITCSEDSCLSRAGEPNEANFFALHQIATSGGPTDGIGIGDIDQGIGTDQDTEWRPQAERIIVWLGDEPSRESRVDRAEAIDALIDNNITVAAVNVHGPGGGIDRNSEATEIVDQTGGSITHYIRSGPVADTILTAVDEALYPRYNPISTPQVQSDGDDPSGIYTGSALESSGSGSQLNITANQMTIANGARLTNLVAGSGDGGDINIQVDDGLTLQNESRLFSINAAEGAGGNVSISAGNVTIQDNAEINITRSQSEEIAGSITVGRIGNLNLQVDDQLMVNDSGGIAIIAVGEAEGDGGVAAIRANDIIVSNGSAITGNSTSLARGSNLNIQANNIIRIANRAQIGSDSFSSEASERSLAGDLTLTARLIQLDNVGEISTSALGPNGQGGTIRINASDAVELRNFSAIQTVANEGNSASGDIFIDTLRLLVETGSRISASTAAAGNGGDIQINSGESITISGFIDITNEEILEIWAVNPVFRAFIENPELFDQLASIFPEVDDFRSVVDNPDEVTRIFSGLTSISTIDSTGNGGDIELSTQQLDLNNQAQIVSQALGTGFAGDIDVNVSDRFYVDAGEVSANSDLSGGGNITINAPVPRQGVVFLRNGSLLSTSVFDSTGGGGNIEIQAGGAFVAIENSDILANAEFGPGGDIVINTPAFLAGIFASGQATPVGRNPGSFEPFRTNDRVDISADSAFGNPGGLDLTDLATDQGATDLPIDLTDPSGLIDRRCSLLARRSDSEFIIEGRGGLPLSPDESTTDLNLLEDFGPDASNVQSSSSETTPLVENSVETNKSPEHIIEPIGWERTADGGIYLRGATTTPPDLFDTRCYDSEST